MTFKHPDKNLARSRFIDACALESRMLFSYDPMSLITGPNGLLDPAPFEDVQTAGLPPAETPADALDADQGADVFPFPPLGFEFDRSRPLDGPNEASLLDTVPSSVLGAIDEDAGAPAGIVGAPVSSLVDFALPSGQLDNVTDPDEGPLLGIAVTAADTANGSWYYSTNHGTSWSPLSAVSDNSARLLDADSQTRLYFQPDPNYNGNLPRAITFRAWDQSSGRNGGRHDTTHHGGTTAFSSAHATAKLVVHPVNDAPVRTSGSVSDRVVVEDSGFTSLGLETIGYGPGGGTDEVLQSLTYEVTEIPDLNVFGRVFLADGRTQVTTGAYTLAELRGMQFAPLADCAGGPLYFRYRVLDSGGTANGGLDTLTESLQITVTPVNDEPVVAANRGMTVARGSLGNMLTTAMLRTRDVDNTSDQLVYTVSSLPLNGVLQHDAAALRVGSQFTQTEIDAGWINYSHDGSQTTTDSFSFVVDDGQRASSRATFHIAVNHVHNGKGVAANDTDAESDHLTITVFTSAQFGVLRVNSSGTWLYAPTFGWVGVDSLTSRAADADEAGARARETVQVMPIPFEQLARFALPLQRQTSRTDRGPDTADPDDPVVELIPLATPSPTAAQTVVPGAPIRLATTGDGSYDRADISNDLARQEAEQSNLEITDDSVGAVPKCQLVGDRPEFQARPYEPTKVRMPSPQVVASAVDTAEQFFEQLDRLGPQFAQLERASSAAVGLTAAVSVASAVYIMWTVRTGYLAASMLTSLPVWVRLDPLPVLDFLRAYTLHQRRDHEPHFLSACSEQLSALLGSAPPRT